MNNQCPYCKPDSSHGCDHRYAVDITSQDRSKNFSPQELETGWYIPDVIQLVGNLTKEIITVNVVKPTIGDIIETHGSGVFTYSLVTKALDEFTFIVECCNQKGELLSDKYQRKYWTPQEFDTRRWIITDISREKMRTVFRTNRICGNIKDTELKTQSLK